MSYIRRWFDKGKQGWFRIYFIHWNWKDGSSKASVMDGSIQEEKWPKNQLHFVNHLVVTHNVHNVYHIISLNHYILIKLFENECKFKKSELYYICFVHLHLGKGLLSNGGCSRWSSYKYLLLLWLLYMKWSMHSFIVGFLPLVRNNSPEFLSSL